MAASFAVGLESAIGSAFADTRALSLSGDSDPLRLELPPASTGDDVLEPAAAAVLGSLYLLSELEQCGVVECAALLADQRWNLDVRDEAAVRALDQYARDARQWPADGARRQLHDRLFGAGGATGTDTSNQVFEELLAGYCDAVLALEAGGAMRDRVVLRTAGDRLRANLAPRQYGNTLIIAKAMVAQVSASLELLAQEGIGMLFHVRGAWGVVRAMQPEGAPDIGRHVDRGQAGRILVSSVGATRAPLVPDGSVRQAAEGWLVATGFDVGSRPEGAR